MSSDNDPNIVLDSKLKIRVINGLRITDISIVPNSVNGNITNPIIMVGEKGNRHRLRGPDHNPGVVVNLRKKVHAVSM
ncbi:hypothetical protein PGB90_004665 [Kerria lacca]